MRYDFDTWRENARALFEITALGDRDRFFAEATFLPHERLIFAQVRFSPQRFDRGPVLARRFDHDYLLFERYLSGSGHGLSVDTPTRVDARTLHLVDVSRPFRTMTTTVETYGLWIPHSAVGYERGKYPPYVSCPLDTPRGRMLEHAFRMLAMAFLSGRPSEIEELVAAFLALVRTFLLGERRIALEQETEAGAAILLRGYIDNNLDNGDFDIEHLCRDFGVSRATLYRLFSEDGGVRHYIRNQRLQRCLAQLLAAEPGRGQVRRIAERWGFDDAGNFNRSFRRQFGFAPSECIGAQARPPAPIGSRPAVGVSNWLRLPQTDRR